MMTCTDFDEDGSLIGKDLRIEESDPVGPSGHGEAYAATRQDRRRKAASFRLPRFQKPMGRGASGHRSGWPYVTDRMRARQGLRGILVDDFVEGSFAPGRQISRWRRLMGQHVWTVPWVGIFHQPPNVPEWFSPKTLEAVFHEPRFLASLPQMTGAVALSEHTAQWLRTRLDVPVTVLKHPTELVDRTFSWAEFEANPDRKLVQIGWYLRNYRAIYQVAVPPGFRKVHLAQSKPFIEAARERTDLHSPLRHRPDVGETDVVSWLENDAYDALLTQNVIFLELFEASANNAVIEAIARNTPLVVNRHPAVADSAGHVYAAGVAGVGRPAA